MPPYKSDTVLQVVITFSWLQRGGRVCVLLSLCVSSFHCCFASSELLSQLVVSASVPLLPEGAGEREVFYLEFNSWLVLNYHIFREQGILFSPMAYFLK